MSGASMCISQYQHLNLIPGGVLRVCAVPDECFPVFSAEVSEGNSNGKVGESRHVYFKELITVLKYVFKRIGGKNAQF